MHSGSQQPAVSRVTYLEVQQTKVFHVTYVENYYATISSPKPNATHSTFNIPIPTYGAETCSAEWVKFQAFHIRNQRWDRCWI